MNAKECTDPQSRTFPGADPVAGRRQGFSIPARHAPEGGLPYNGGSGPSYFSPDGVADLPSCTVTGWDPDSDDRLERALHLRAAFQGDVIQISLSGAVAADPAWVATFDQAIRLGLQLELFVSPKEVGSFVREWEQSGVRHKELVLYDTMPGGTGYLRRLMEDLPHISSRVVEHLTGCTCERACYKCLKEFWNQRLHHLLDKRLALTAMRTLAASRRPPRLDGPEEVRFESFLEARFYRLLQEAGMPLPKTQEIIRTRDSQYILRADFRWLSASISQ